MTACWPCCYENRLFWRVQVPARAAGLAEVKKCIARLPLLLGGVSVSDDRWRTSTEPWNFETS
jgi:hypothetical protein